MTSTSSVNVPGEDIFSNVFAPLFVTTYRKMELAAKICLFTICLLPSRINNSPIFKAEMKKENAMEDIIQID